MRDTRMLAAAGAVGLWSTNAYAAGFALARMSVTWLLLIQFTTAALVYTALRARRRPARGTGRRVVGRALALGVVGLTGTIFLQYVAFALAPIVAANVLAYGWPLLAAVGVATIRRDRAALAGAGLAVLGFAGVALIFTAPAPGTTSSALPGAAAGWGYAAALGSALCMTAYTLGPGRLTAGVSDLLLPATACGAAVAAVLAVTTDAPAPTAAGVAAAAYIGLGPMAAGYGLWTHAITGDGAARFAPLGYATPMLSTALLLTTGAPATLITLLGIGLVLACSLGVLAVDRYSPRPVTANTSA